MLRLLFSLLLTFFLLSLISLFLLIWLLLLFLLLLISLLLLIFLLSRLLLLLLLVLLLLLLVILGDLLFSSLILLGWVDHNFLILLINISRNDSNISLTFFNYSLGMSYMDYAQEREHNGQASSYSHNLIVSYQWIPLLNSSEDSLTVTIKVFGKVPRFLLIVSKYITM